MQKGQSENGDAKAQPSKETAVGDLRSRYLARLEQKSPELAACAFPLTASQRLWMIDETHSLAGSGGCFGYWPISQHARKLENLLREMPQTSDAELSAVLKDLSDAVAAAIADLRQDSA